MTNIEVIEPANEQAWLEARLQDITSTDAAALFGISPYQTEYELWHQKRARQIVQIDGNERIDWGRALEPAIAREFCRRQGWRCDMVDLPFAWEQDDERPARFTATPDEPIVARCGAYIRDPKTRTGSSFDYRRYHPGGWENDELIEIKNVDARAFAQKWRYDQDEQLEAPPHIELQVQHQLMVTGLQHAWLVALVGGNEMHVAQRKPDPEIHAALRERIAKFWASIEANEPPTPNYLLDYDRIAQVSMARYAGTEADADEETAQLMQDLHAAQTQRKQAEQDEKRIKAQLLEKVGEHSKVRASCGTLSCGMTKANPGKLITEDMVGTYQGARAAFRMLRFTPTKD